MKNFKWIPTGSKSKSKLPHCIHGPNLLLESINEENKRIFVCSADRTNECKQIYNFDLQRFRDAHRFRRKKSRKRLIAALKASRQQRNWCVDCSEFFLLDEEFRHEQHLVKRNISKRQIQRPTELISAIVDKSEEAQYFFTKESMQVVMQTIRRAEFTDILCIGCPSVHQHLRIHKDRYNIRSMLLDIDKRYLQFFPASQFLCFNMVNGFCFETPELEQHLDNFLKNSKRLLILIDPPFGALIPALGDTIRKLQKRLAYLKREPADDQQSVSQTSKDSQVTKKVSDQIEQTKSPLYNLMIFHLYFFEKHIVSEFPGVKMMDFQLSYANHAKMNQKDKSIARIFTDLDARSVKLPKKLGYKFCQHCQRYVNKVAEHCFECKNCGAKDGKPSVHCAVCDKCVKNTWKHCFVCEMCTLPGRCKCGEKKRDNCVDSEEELTVEEKMENGREERRSFKSKSHRNAYEGRIDRMPRNRSFDPRNRQFKSERTNRSANKKSFWNDKIRQDQEFGDGFQQDRQSGNDFKRDRLFKTGFNKNKHDNFRNESESKATVEDNFAGKQFDRFQSENQSQPGSD